MTIAWRVVWAVSSNDTQQEFVDLAREGERLLVALGGRAPSPAASSLNVESDNSAFGRWTDAYNSEQERVQSMPLSILFAGVSGWDPRSDQLVMRAAVSDSPAWSTVYRELEQRVTGDHRAELLRLAEWFKARAVGLATGDEGQQLQERAQRGWWWELARRFPSRPVAPQPPQTPPQPSPPSSGGGGGWGWVLAFIGAGIAQKSRRRRG